jgi:hypothetical protein
MVEEGGGAMPSRKYLDKKSREVQELQEYKLKDVPPPCSQTYNRPISLL